MVIEKEVIDSWGNSKIYLLHDDYYEVCYDGVKRQIEVVDTKNNRVVYCYEADGTMEDPTNEHESGDRVEEIKERINYYFKEYYRIEQKSTQGRFDSLPVPYLPYDKQKIYCRHMCVRAVVSFDLNAKEGEERFVLSEREGYRIMRPPCPPRPRWKFPMSPSLCMYMQMKSRDADNGYHYISPSEISNLK